MCDTFRYGKVRHRFQGKILSDKEVCRSLADARQGKLTQDAGILPEGNKGKYICRADKACVRKILEKALCIV